MNAIKTAYNVAQIALMDALQWRKKSITFLANYKCCTEFSIFTGTALALNNTGNLLKPKIKQTDEPKTVQE